MNPLKTLFQKVFETTPPEDAPETPKVEVPFEWNPDEAVAPTSARTTSWKRGDAADEAAHRAEEAAHRAAGDAAAGIAAHNLPAPMFEPRPAKGSLTSGPIVAPPVPATAQPLAPKPEARPAAQGALPQAESVPATVRIAPSAAQPEPPQPQALSVAPPFPAPAAAVASESTSGSLVPLSDFEDVYRKAGIKSPVHGYGVERVYRLLTSRRLVGLDRSIRRSALLTALDAAGVPASDVSQDAVLRRKALTAHEAEKALELQSLRSRNESRVEALQDTVETFTRQKQGQIERLAQGSTNAVRAQSDLEIRKRMEQDRLFRSLAYFVEPLPPPAVEARTAPSEASRGVQRFDATIEMGASVLEDLNQPVIEAEASPRPVVIEPPVEAVTVRPEDTGPAPRPVAQSGLEMALRAAAQEARVAAQAQKVIKEDGASDAVEALRKLREAGKTGSES
jgi:hypothetical protein